MSPGESPIREISGSPLCSLSSHLLSLSSVWCLAGGVSWVFRSLSLKTAAYCVAKYNPM